MILAELVKDRVSVTMLLDQYGVQVDRGGRCACPIHHGKDKNMTVKSKWFRCFRCGKSGTVIDLQMALSGSDFSTAIKELDSMFALNLEPSKPSEQIAARLALANHRKQKQDRVKRHERNHRNYTVLCYLRRWLDACGKDCTALDKLLDYYQAYDDNDLVPDAINAAALIGMRDEMEVMIIAAFDGETNNSYDG